MSHRKGQTVILILYCEESLKSPPRSLGFSRVKSRSMSHEAKRKSLLLAGFAAWLLGLASLGSACPRLVGSRLELCHKTHQVVPMAQCRASLLREAELEARMSDVAVVSDQYLSPDVSSDVINCRQWCLGSHSFREGGWARLLDLRLSLFLRQSIPARIRNTRLVLSPLTLLMRQVAVRADVTVRGLGQGHRRLARSSKSSTGTNSALCFRHSRPP